MSTAVYYPEEKHSLPSLSSIMNNQPNDELFSNASQPSTANTTPASSFSGKSGVPENHLMGINQVGQVNMNGLNNLNIGKCTCKSNANRIPRPRNAFILFRQKYHQSVLEEGSVIRTNPEVSRELGRRWRALSNEDREHWNQLAEEEKTNHAKKYPGYRYTPRRNGKNKNCDFCKQKNLRQQQIQLHNQQLLQLQDQYYMNHQQPPPPQQGQNQLGPQSFQHPPPPQQFNQQSTYNYPFNSQLPINNMQFFIPSNLNPIQTNFVYNQDDKLSPLSQPFEQQVPNQPNGQFNNPQFAIGYERYNLPNPYGFENNYSS